MRYFKAAAALLALSLASAGCSGGDGGGGGTPVTPPVPGVLTLNLTTPNVNDRAIRLTLTGPQITQVEAVGAGLVLHQRASGSAVEMAVFGTLPNGGMLRFTVPDVNKATSYTATIADVADNTNQLRASLAGYAATVVR